MLLSISVVLANFVISIYGYYDIWDHNQLVPSRYEGHIQRKWNTYGHPPRRIKVKQTLVASNMVTCCDHVFLSIPNQRYGGEVGTGTCLGAKTFNVDCRKFTSFRGPHPSYLSYDMTCSCPGQSVCSQSSRDILVAHCELPGQMVDLMNGTYTILKHESEHQSSVEAILKVRSDVEALLTSHKQDVWVLATCYQTTVQKREWFNGRGLNGKQADNALTLGIKDTHRPGKLYSSFTVPVGWGGWKFRKINRTPGTLVCAVTGGHAVHIIMKLHYFSMPSGTIFSEPDAVSQVKRQVKRMNEAISEDSLDAEVTQNEDGTFHGRLGGQVLS